MKVDSPTNWRRILAGRESCKRHEIRNQNGARHRLGAQHGGERIERKMMAIRNKGRCEPIISQLRPDEIRMAGQHVGHTVAEMSRKARPGIHGCVNLIRARAGMTERNVDAACRNLADVFWRLRVMWRERYHADEIVAGCLPADELGDIRRANVLERVRTAWTILGRNVRTFDVASWRERT